MVVGGNEVEDRFYWPQVEMLVDSPNRELNVSIQKRHRLHKTLRKKPNGWNVFLWLMTTLLQRI